MKMRIVSIIFCLIAFVASMLLMFNIYNRKVDPMDTEKDPIDSHDPNETDRQEPVSQTSIKKLSSDIVKFIDTLAYESDKSYETKMDNYINQLKKASEFLKNEMSDDEGAIYFEELSIIFETLKTSPYMSAPDFSAAAGTTLTKIDNNKPKKVENADFYPQINTDINGPFTLAMLAINNSKKNSNIFTITIGGSVILGDVAAAEKANSFAGEYEKYSSNSFPLRGVSAIFGTDDYSVLTLKNSLTEETSSSDARSSVKGKPEYAAMLSAAGVNAVNIATEHILDYGEKGLSDTKFALQNAGVNFFLEKEVLEYETSIGKMFLIGYDLSASALNSDSGTFNESVKKDIASARERGAAFVITAFNWQGNSNKEISDYQVSVGRGAVDNGADMVIGSYPQFIQAVDIYKGKSIIYSTNDLVYGKTDILSTESSDNINGFVFSQDFIVENGSLTPSQIVFYPVVSSSEEGRNNFMPKLLFDASASGIIETFKKSCTCTRYGIAKDTNPDKQEIKFIQITK